MKNRLLLKLFLNVSKIKDSTSFVCHFFIRTLIKTFAKSVINDRDFLIEAYGHSSSSDDTALELREGVHTKLWNYACSLATVVEPLKRSVQWVHGELAKAQALNSDRAIPWEKSNPLVITEDTYRKILTIFWKLFLQSSTRFLIQNFQHGVKYKRKFLS